MKKGETFQDVLSSSFLALGDGQGENVLGN